MSVTTIKAQFAILIVASCLTGCAVTNQHSASCDSCVGGTQCSSCDNGCSSCQQADKIERWSPEWYAIEAESPVGARQVLHKGKMWPPYPRPTGKQQQLSHRYHAAHYWPHPYDCQDRAIVREWSRGQVANGWKVNNTLYDYHFDPDTQELTHPGRLHLQWILDYSPAQHRTVWIQKVIDSELNQQRLALVEAESIALAGGQSSVDVQLHKATPLGRPAQEIDLIREADLNTIPAPRIDYTPLPTGTD